MKQIELALESTNGYIKSFNRNTEKGWWEIEVGLPISWVYDENSKIGCEIINENEIGKLIKVFPKLNGVVIDDLINFIEIIIVTNQKIAEKEKQFTDKMQEMKNHLEDEANKFYKELEELKENSFKKNNNDFIQNLKNKKVASNNTKSTDKLKSTTKRKPRTLKKINTVTEESSKK
jgi:hypothetical protein